MQKRKVVSSRQVATQPSTATSWFFPNTGDSPVVYQKAVSRRQFVPNPPISNPFTSPPANPEKLDFRAQEAMPTNRG